MCVCVCVRAPAHTRLFYSLSFYILAFKFLALSLYCLPFMYFSSCIYIYCLFVPLFILMFICVYIVILLVGFPRWVSYLYLDTLWEVPLGGTTHHFYHLGTMCLWFHSFCYSFIYIVYIYLFIYIFIQDRNSTLS